MNLKDEDIVELFFDVERLNRRYSEKKYGSINPYKGQMRCLLFLDLYGPATQKELTEKLGIRQASVSDIVSKLEKKGHIIKKVSESDKRISYISLTELGKESVKKIKKLNAETQSEMLSDLNDEEKENFYNVLKKIRNFYVLKKESEKNE